MLVEGVVSVVVVGAVVEVVKKTGVVPNNWLPLLSAVLGIVLGVANSLTLDTPYVVGGALAGLVVGLTASGAYDVGSRTVAAVVKK